MGVLDDFARDKSGPQLTMLFAIALLFVSQFFLYWDDPGIARLGVGSDFRTNLTIFSFKQHGTGWEVHPYVPYVLIVLTIAFLNKSILANPIFRSLGWWGAMILMFLSSADGAPFQAWGAGMGYAAMFIALLAALGNHFDNKRAATGNTPPKPDSGPAVHAAGVPHRSDNPPTRTPPTRNKRT